MFKKQNIKFSGLLLGAAFVAAFALNFVVDAKNGAFAANTASIETSGQINLQVSASGNGANVVADEVTVKSTCDLGYTFSIKGPADNTLYKDGDKTTNNIATTKIAPSAGTKLAPTNINSNKNTWGVSIDSNTTISTSTYFGLTSTAIDLFEKASASETDGDKYSIYYGASVDNTIEPGQYKLAESSTGANDNVITYILTTDPECSRYAIRYNDNGANSSTKMGNQTVDSSTDLTFWASNFQRSGYGFAGWNTKADGTGTNYGPNQTIQQADLQDFLDANVKVENGKQYVDLYAMWIQSAGNIQSWSGCSSMSVGDVTALTDQRDDNTYAVAKLADGKCWMIENLRLDNTANGNATGDLSQGYASNFKGLANPEAPWADNSTTANSLYSIDGSNGTNSITGTNQASRFPRYNNDNTNNTVSNMETDDANVYSYGNYYTWAAAIADISYHASNETISNTSICPKGWHLPSGMTGGEFSALDSAMGGTGGNQTNNIDGSNRWRAYPNNFILSGRLTSNRGFQGVYWSSTSGNNIAYAYFFTKNVVYPATDWLTANRAVGVAIRCISDNSRTISFNANGGSGTMSDQSVNAGETVNLNANTFTAPAGKMFVGWNTAADGSGTSYANNATINASDLTGNITLYAQWGSMYVSYHGNGNTSTFGMGQQQVTSGTTMLWASNYARAGYGFVGWSLDVINPDASNAATLVANAAAANKIYGPNQDVPTSDIAGKTLYAVWIKSAGNMQRWSGCSSMSINEVTALTDTRDNNTYAIAKLPGGKCWMIENLRLGSSATLSASNTHNPSITKLLASQDPSTNAWCRKSTADCVDQLIYYDGNVTASVNTMTGPNENVYSYGNYYNWHAATAGRGTYSFRSGNPTGSICPYGWKLPTGAAQGQNVGQFYDLNYAVNGGVDLRDEIANGRIRSYPVNFVYSGDIYGASKTDRGDMSRYWSSTTNSNLNAFDVLAQRYNPTTGKSSISPVTGSSKISGLPIRCVNP